MAISSSIQSSPKLSKCRFLDQQLVFRIASTKARDASINLGTRHCAGVAAGSSNISNSLRVPPSKKALRWGLERDSETKPSDSETGILHDSEMEVVKLESRILQLLKLGF